MNLNDKKPSKNQNATSKTWIMTKAAQCCTVFVFFLWCTDKKFKKAIDSIALLANAEMQIVAYYLLQLQFVKNK